MSITSAEEGQLLSKGGGMPFAPTTAGVPQAAAQTFDRRFAISAAWAPTTQTLTCTSIWLPQGQVVSAITFMSGAQAEATGLHLWFALYRSDTGALLAQSADNTAAVAFAASLALRQTLTAAVACPYSGLYYIGFMCQATTLPTLLCLTSAVVTNNGAVATTKPDLAFTADAALTTTAPATLGAKTTIVQALWAAVD